MFRQVLRATSRASITATTIAAFALQALHPATASAQYSSIYFFGDSFTDVGSAQGLALLNALPDPTPSPPYAAGGRFSNGAIWSELFASKFTGLANTASSAWVGTGNNYAVGGATTGLTGAYGSPTGIGSQAAKFVSANAAIAPGALFVLWGGGNDITDAAALANPLSRQAAIVQAAKNVTDFAGYLALNYGVQNFLVPLIPNVGAAPFYLGDPTHVAIATGLTTQFNQLVSTGIQALDAYPGINASTLDLNTLLLNIQLDAATGGSRYGITNTALPCFALPNPTIACQSSLFVDQLHGTEIVQQLIADAAYQRVVNGVDVSVVPEPSTLALLGVGLALSAFAARRKRAA